MVIGIIGILAAGIIAVVNPGEQLAKARDAGRKSTIAQLVKAEQGYFISKLENYSPVTSTWIDTLVTAGELKSVPSAIPNTPICLTSGGGSVGNENNFCYDSTSGLKEVLIYTALESTAEKNKCLGTPTQPVPHFLYSSLDGKSGVVCLRLDQSALFQSTPTTSGGGYTYF